MNVAQRTVLLGAELGDPSGEVNILISGELREAVTSRMRVRHLGTRHLRGRAKPVEVFMLDSAGG